MSKKEKSKRRDGGVWQFVDKCVKKGIQLLAVDFDSTLISIHSGGIWKDSVDKLSQHIRPCMKDLIDAALSSNVNVCIVTYFQQPWLIKEMLDKVFPREAGKILVQANSLDFRRKHNYEFLGKEAHIAAILTELYNKHHLKIKPNEIVLLDDDSENTEIALRFGHFAFLVEDDISDATFEKFATTLDSVKRRP